MPSAPATRRFASAIASIGRDRSTPTGSKPSAGQSKCDAARASAMRPVPHHVPAFDLDVHRLLGQVSLEISHARQSPMNFIRQTARRIPSVWHFPLHRLGRRLSQRPTGRHAK